MSLLINNSSRIDGARRAAVSILPSLITFSLLRRYFAYHFTIASRLHHDVPRGGTSSIVDWLSGMKSRSRTRLFAESAGTHRGLKTAAGSAADGMAAPLRYRYRYREAYRRSERLSLPPSPLRTLALNASLRDLVYGRRRAATRG